MTERAKSNRREPKSCLGRVFNFKIGCFGDVNVLSCVEACRHLELKTWPRFCPVDLSLPRYCVLLFTIGLAVILMGKDIKYLLFWNDINFFYNH